MKFKRRFLPTLSRRGALIRNLLITALLVAGSWVLAGCPAWTPAGALRQFERTLLLEPGAVRYRESGADMSRVLVTGEGYAYTVSIARKALFWFEPSLYQARGADLRRGPVLFPWTEWSDAYSMEQGTWLCPNPPEGAQRAELTISLDYELDGGLVLAGLWQTRDYESGSAVLRAQGNWETPGLMRLDLSAENPRAAVLLQELFFQNGRETAEEGDRTRDCSLTRIDYDLRFFDGEGTPVPSPPAVLPLEF